jgi:hypothetical protein
MTRDTEPLGLRWGHMSKMQTGRYGEMAAMMAFIAHGFDVYSTEVDERGVDFICRRPDGSFYEVQVKTLRALDYAFMRKAVFPLRDSMVLCLVLLLDGEAPALYLIPSMAWATPDAMLVDRDYEGLKSAPEYGISLTKRNMALLEQYEFDRAIRPLA